MTEPPITDHTFRLIGHTSIRHVDAGQCCYNGTCNRPQDDHITVSGFRARRAAGAR